jgi:hypothetical protein
MRTKTLALSAVLGMLGTASVMAQANVYSLNAVGYINVTMPPGYSIVTCPLIVGTDPNHPTLTNDLNVLFPQGADQYDGGQVLSYINGTGFGPGDIGSTSGSWAGGGTITLLPGSAVFFLNNTANPMTATFVGTVPQGSLTNTIVTGYNLVGSMVPTSGDFVLNTILDGGGSYVNGFGPNGPSFGDQLYFYTPGQGYAGPSGNCIFGGSGSWTGGSGANQAPATPPAVDNGGVAEGFWYFSNGSTPNNWIENFLVNP